MSDEQRQWFRSVDDDPEVSLLLSRMDETAQWGATLDLRAWERAQLALQPGQRLLDVGCGLGEAARALAADLGGEGEVVGVDGSAAMVAEATRRSVDAACSMRFEVGDALALQEADDTFDAVRSERMLQWVPDPARAVAEMARVVRPGGRVCLIDTDWSTYDIETDDPTVSARIRAAYRVEWNRHSMVGGRLQSLAADAGLTVVAEHAATHVWSAWDPDTTPRLSGWVLMSELADDLIACGELDVDERDAFVASVEDAARRGRFTMRLTMFGVLGEAWPT